MADSQTGKQRKTSAAAESARQTYRQAVQRGASPRERSSVSEHLDFLRSQIADNDPMAGLIDQIKEDLA